MTPATLKGQVLLGLTHRISALPTRFRSGNSRLKRPDPMLRTLLVHMHMHSRFHHLYRTVYSPFTSQLVNWPLLSRRKVGEKKQT